MTSNTKTTPSVSATEYTTFETFPEDPTEEPSTSTEQESSTKSKKQKKIKNKKSTNTRRERQAQRNTQKRRIQNQIQTITQNLEELLEAESNRNIEEILKNIRALSNVYGDSDSTNENEVYTNMKMASAGIKRRDYRMIWAGSDEAICHLGTGLHKVPLARLQVS